MPPTIDSPAASRFRTDIQGLRAIAVLAVVLYHAGIPFLPGGYVGVDLFFVISGFLITTHLVTSLEQHGRISLASFYAKRVRRIIPASAFVLVLSVLAALIWFPPLLMGEVWRGAVATALYVPNLLFAIDGTDYLAESTPSLFQHYWSLGIEEQFYLVWPLVLIASWALIRSKRALFAVLCGLTAVSFVACVLLTFRAQPWAFFSLPTRAWELGVGGLAGFFLLRRPVALPPLPAAVAGWVGIATIIAAIILFDESTPFPGYWAAVPVLATALVIVSGATPTDYGPGRLLSLRPMVQVGTISYSLYLLHWPALIIPQTASGWDAPLPLWVTIAIAALCVPGAWLMYRYVENPARSAGWLAKARPRRSLLGAAATSATAIAIASAALAYSSTVPLHMDKTADRVPASSPPSFTDFVPENLTPSLREADDDNPILYARGCHQSFTSRDSTGCLFGPQDAPRIVLFGDSHAAQWFPAVEGFAAKNGYAVQTFTKSSCRSLMLDQKRDGVPYTECMQWRDAVIEKLNAEAPALVILANYTGGVVVGGSVATPDGWRDAIDRTAKAIGAPVAIMADTPDLGETPSICLSAHLSSAEDCGAPIGEALRYEVRAAEAAAAEANELPIIDMTPAICSAERCSPVVGDTLVYRDAHHLTATYSAQLSDAFAEQFAQAVARPTSDGDAHTKKP